MPDVVNSDQTGNGYNSAQHTLDGAGIRKHRHVTIVWGQKEIHKELEQQPEAKLGWRGWKKVDEGLDLPTAKTDGITWSGWSHKLRLILQNHWVLFLYSSSVAVAASWQISTDKHDKQLQQPSEAPA